MRIFEFMDNKVIIFSAPSGSGKSTIISHCMGVFPSLAFSVSAASRAPRGQERDGVEYYFLTPDEFRRRIDNGDFVEWQQVYPGSYYGTLKSEVERIWKEGKVIVFDVDVVGGYNLKKYFGDRAMSVFIQAPGIDELRKRLISRNTDAPDAIERRVAKAATEIEFARGKFDRVIVNDVLDKAFADAEEMIGAYLAK